MEKLEAIFDNKATVRVARDLLTELYSADAPADLATLVIVTREMRRWGNGLNMQMGDYCKIFQQLRDKGYITSDPRYDRKDGTLTIVSGIQMPREARLFFAQNYASAGVTK